MVEDRHAYPPDAVLGLDDRRLSFNWLFAIAVFVLALVDYLVFGLPETAIPFNYPYFLAIFLFLGAILYLHVNHREMWNVAEELADIARYNEDDPLAVGDSIEADEILDEVSRILHLSYHPITLLVGGIVGGAAALLVMIAFDAFQYYPYVVMSTSIGFFHGLHLGPWLGGLYMLKQMFSRYIIDIDLLDPDGIGGFRQIGDSVVIVSSFGLVFVTFDFIGFSSVAFTPLTRFRWVLLGLYFLVLMILIGTTVAVTVLIRRRLQSIRERKVEKIQRLFYDVEHRFWENIENDEENIQEAVNIISMQSMFMQMSSMNLWPINLYSLVRLTLSVALSLAVLVLQGVALF